MRRVTENLCRDSVGGTPFGPAPIRLLLLLTSEDRLFTRVRSHSRLRAAPKRTVYVCMCVCVCMYVCMLLTSEDRLLRRVRSHSRLRAAPKRTVYVCVCVCVYVCMYVLMYVCMYVVD
jgi:hypothetical protein